MTDDNCCLCNLAGIKYLTELEEEHILFASFRNHVFEVGMNSLLIIYI